ncbi:signal peptidase I [Niallia sp. NCCP-28]|uniref:signal peptidase I n=1 Tax=Niallia sp. NCCP-28 TaxID=2934712 RepID=UPI00208B1CEC|nr:signal peptidase I [Niallia sp. NCCP-28]GKU82647.1 signal peptidase I [Niallia sp. NCCP-28]
MKKKSELFEWSKSIFVAVAIAIVVRTFVFTPIVVDGESMEPTLNNEDRMVVSKIGTPKRFDIIVFHATAQDDYIKRVIGLPGDTIEYKNDILYINGKAYKEDYLKEKKQEVKEQYGADALLTENFNLKDYTGFEKVPKNTLFVMGDNRRNSKDSREIGVIPFDKVVGSTNLVYWPLKDAQMTK